MWERQKSGGMGRKGNWEREMRREGWTYGWEERRKKERGSRSSPPDKTLDVHKIESMLAHIFVCIVGHHCRGVTPPLPHVCCGICCERSSHFEQLMKHCALCITLS